MSWRDDYRQYLQSKEWRWRRRSRIAQTPYCERCQFEVDLVVHHKNYLRIGRELDTDLEVLCKWCHNEHHGADPGKTPKATRKNRKRVRIRKLHEKQLERRKAAHDAKLTETTNWDFRQKLLSGDYWGRAS
jgi:5-methylcytosine-specific restriction endonuclease McrA